METGNSTADSAEVDSNKLFSITEEGYKQFAFVSNICLTPVVCGLGLAGNALGFGVLRREQKKLSVYVYMCALTFFDGLYLLVGLLRCIPRFIELHDKYLGNRIESYEQLGSIYVDMILSHTSTALILLMSVERLMALVRPFTVKQMWIAKYPHRLIVVCFFVNVIFLLPFPINFEVKSFVNGENMTEYYLQFKEDSEEFMDKYMAVQTTVDYYLPGLTILIINVAIPVAYYCTLRQQSTRLTSAIGNQQTKITLTVLCITIMYFLLSLPNLFIKTLAFFDEGYSFEGKYKLTFWLFIDISNLFANLNAANDFIIYIIVSAHYRKIFVAMYCRMCRRRFADDVFDSLGEAPSTNVSRIATVSDCGAGWNTQKGHLKQ